MTKKKNLFPAVPVSQLFGSRIYDGKDVSIESFPYQVSIESYGYQVCGGSIVNTNWVITAGHCSKEEELTVRSGSSLREQGGSVHLVDKIVFHPRFGRKNGIPQNDIALLHVKEPFAFGKTRQPIRLFGAREKVSSGKMANVTGWGKTRTTTPENLQSVEVPLIDTDLCRQAYNNSASMTVPEGYICAAYFGEGGKNACHGDSGGPLAVDGRLAGIVSWSYGCAEPDYPTVYTDVAYYRNWIDKEMERR